MLIFVIFVCSLGSEFTKPENTAKNKYLETKKTNIRIKSIVNIRKYTKYELITTDFK